LSKDEEKFFKKFVKVLGYLQQNPRHNSLQTHEIDDLTRKYGFKIFQSYLENNTPSAGRLFWAYGPDKQDITVLGVEPHPEDQKRGAYLRIKLAAMPPSRAKTVEKPGS
jgi:ABC-type lipoprotein release transport system permease subunit